VPYITTTTSYDQDGKVVGFTKKKLRSYHTNFHSIEAFGFTDWSVIGAVLHTGTVERGHYVFWSCDISVGEPNIQDLYLILYSRGGNVSPSSQFQQVWSMQSRGGSHLTTLVRHPPTAAAPGDQSQAISPIVLEAKSFSGALTPSGDSSRQFQVATDVPAVVAGASLNVASSASAEFAPPHQISISAVVVDTKLFRAFAACRIACWAESASFTTSPTGGL
jgi:hypothetical protein